MVVFWVFASAGTTVQEASQAVDVVIYLTGADLRLGATRFLYLAATGIKPWAASR